jgi:hypothetical protein
MSHEFVRMWKEASVTSLGYYRKIIFESVRTTVKNRMASLQVENRIWDLQSEAECQMCSTKLTVSYCKKQFLIISVRVEWCGTEGLIRHCWLQELPRLYQLAKPTKHRQTAGLSVSHSGLPVGILTSLRRMYYTQSCICSTTCDMKMIRVPAYVYVIV